MKKLLGIIIIIECILAFVVAKADFYAQHGIVWQTGTTTIVMTRDGNLWAIEDQHLRCGDKVFVVLHDSFTDDTTDDEVVECFAEF